MALKNIDSGHIEKFLKDLNSNYPIHFYKTTGFNKIEPKIEARAFITNKHLCSFLYEDLGLIPNRYDASKIIAHIPEQFHKYFILGVFDADGSFSAYKGDYGSKLSISFGGSSSLLRFIENHLINNKLVAMRKIKEHKLWQRHEGKDGNWRVISFAGIPQGMKILNYLYDSPIYLDRKYQKYLAIPYHNS